MGWNCKKIRPNFHRKSWSLLYFFALVRLSNNPPNIFEQSLSKILGTPLSTTWMVKNRPGVCPCGYTIRLKHHQASPGCGRDPKAATSCGSGSLDFPKVCVTKMAGRYIMTWGRWIGCAKADGNTMWLDGRWMADGWIGWLDVHSKFGFNQFNRSKRLLKHVKMMVIHSLDMGGLSTKTSNAWSKLYSHEERWL